MSDQRLPMNTIKTAPDHVCHVCGVPIYGSRSVSGASCASHGYGGPYRFVEPCNILEPAPEPKQEPKSRSRLAEAIRKLFKRWGRKDG